MLHATRHVVTQGHTQHGAALWTHELLIPSTSFKQLENAEAG